MSLVFSGIRPSGPLHLGNYLGAIRSWLELQKKYPCIYGVMDYHAITTPFRPQDLRRDTKNLILDLLALGLDLKKSTLILQSAMPEHLELAWILSTITPLSRLLLRMPTYKEKIRLHPKYINLGLLSYPVLMTADILIYQADLVPVGEDQLPHIELANELLRRFNRMFGQTFSKVKPILTAGARITSLVYPDKKMSKTGDEGIALSDSPKEIRRKIKKATTDSGREVVFDPREKPAISNLLNIYHLLSSFEIKEIEKKYRGKGYAEFKADLAEVVVKFLNQYHERRAKLEKNYGEIEKILKENIKKARVIAENNLKEIKKKVGIK